jgi:death on curing protein
MSAGRELRWMTRQMAEAIHDGRLAVDGGLPGIRDAGTLESALGRPVHRWHYGEARDVADCAASYGFAIARNHAFNDGNKRTAFVVMATFLQLNGRTLIASESDAVETMVAVAEGSLSEEALAAWLRGNCEGG